MSHMPLKRILDEAGEDLTLLPAGEYALEFVSCKPRNTDVMPTFRVVGGPYDGKRVMAGTFGSIAGNGPRIAKQLWTACGLGDDFFSDATSLEDVAQALIGRVIAVQLVQEINPKAGDLRNKIRIGSVRLVSAPAAAGIPSVAVGAPVAPPVAPAAPPTPAAPAPVTGAPVAPPPTTVAAPAPGQVPPPSPAVAQAYGEAAVPLPPPAVVSPPSASYAAPPPVAPPAAPPAAPTAPPTPAAPAVAPPEVPVPEEPDF